MSGKSSILTPLSFTVAGVDKATRVAYLSPTFFPYRVPVFDQLAEALGENFTVVAYGEQSEDIGRIALSMGTFRRRLVAGRFIPLSRYDDKGQETPACVALSPSIPFVLASLRPKVVISANFNLWTLTSIAMGYRTVIAWEGTRHTERTVQVSRTRLRRWMAGRAKAFVVNGVASRRYLMEVLGVSLEKILEGGMCAHPSPAHIQRHPRTVQPGERIQFLFVGRMIDRKGAAHLLQAAALLSGRLGRRGQFEVVLLGDGPERSRYEKLARELGLGDSVAFKKFVHPDEVWHYYAQAHVFVLPTLQDHWPLVIPEAMSMSLPVLVSKHAGSVPDLLSHGENGYTFDPEDHSALAACMEEYIRNPQLVRRHGERNLAFVSPYNPERVAQVYLRAVQMALA